MFLHSHHPAIYRCPELLMGSVDQTPAVDMWNVGLLVGQMVSGKALLPGGILHTAILNRMLRSAGSPHRKISPPWMHRLLPEC